MKALRLFVILALVTVANVARAQDEAAIDDAYQKAGDGLREFKAGHYSEALDNYTRAYAIVHLPALAVHIARANVRLGRFVTALRFYDEAVKLGDGVGEPKVQARARTNAQAEGRVLALRIPKLVFRASGIAASGMNVKIDGAQLPAEGYKSGWLVDPGSHQVTASFGTQQQNQWISVSEGQVRELTFAFISPALSRTGSRSLAEPNDESLKVQPISTMRKVAWASFGLGGAGLLVWGVAGAVALNKSNHLKSLQCGGNQHPCPSAERENYDNWKTAATVGFYVGTAAALTGATLYFAEPKQKKSRDSKPRVVAWAGVGSVGVEGQF